MIAEIVRRYWFLGMDCSLLEVQKLAWFLERSIESQDIKSPLQLGFKANNYGPYADKLRHLLNSLDGSYLKSEKRIANSDPLDVIWFNDQKRDRLHAYLQSEAKEYLAILDKTTDIINGFESPFGMKLLSTVDWLIVKKNCRPTSDDIIEGIKNWPAGNRWAVRKLKLFNKKSVNIALNRLNEVTL